MNANEGADLDNIDQIVSQMHNSIEQKIYQMLKGNAQLLGADLDDFVEKTK